VALEISERLRRAVAQRAGYRCEYCLIHEEDSGFPHHIDHVISRKHGGPSELGNLAYACAPCNRNKGTDVAAISLETGDAIRLFDPRRDRWSDHFQVTGSFIEPRSSAGAATAKLLRFNAPERLAERELLQQLGRYPRST
jgi:hypothetical protein